MNKNTLSLLGCGSIALMLLSSQAANASTFAPQNVGQPEIEFKAPNADKVNAPLSQENPQPTSLNAMSDTIGDMAVAKFGCDCMSCRNQVLAMVQSGQLSVAQ